MKNIGQAETRQSEVNPTKRTSTMPDTNSSRVVMDGSKGSAQAGK